MALLGHGRQIWLLTPLPRHQGNLDLVFKLNTNFLKLNTICFMLKEIFWKLNTIFLWHRDRDLKNCQVIQSDKSNLLRKVDFLLKRCFQDVGLFIFSGGRIPCYNFRKLYLQMDWTIIFGTSQNNVWLVYFSEYFPNWLSGCLCSLWSRGFTILQSRTPKWLLSNSKAVSNVEIVPVLQ